MEKPLRKTQSTLTAAVMAITGIRLPRKNSIPLTEEVISVRSVFFSFSSARDAATQSIPVTADIHKDRAQGQGIGTHVRGSFSVMVS